MRKVAIIGAGSFGRAIEHVLQDRQNVEVSLWDKGDSKVPNQGDLSEAVGSAEIVFLCVNSWGWWASRAG